MRARKVAAAVAAVTLSLGLVACGSESSESSSDTSGSGDWSPVTVEHAFGETTIESEPERVATVDFANQDVALALGVVPVGMAKMTWGDDGGEDGNGIQPWAEDKLEELGGETPVLFDETDGYDYEAIADTEPDVILAAYSGMDKEAYETLSEIAPTVAYPDNPWATTWRDAARLNAKALGMDEEVEKVIADVEKDIADAVAEHPEIEGANGAFITHVDPSDLSEINFYSAADTRSKFLKDLGMNIAPSIVEATKGGAYNGSISTEQADKLNDVDVIITYGGDELFQSLKGDPVLSKLTAIKNGAFVNLDGSKPIGTAANPTVLSTPALIDEYASMIGEALADSGSQ